MLADADGLFDAVAGARQVESEARQGPARDRVADAQDAEQQVFGADPVVAEPAGFFLGRHDDVAGGVGEPFEHGLPPRGELSIHPP